jgi:hypothetical protein
MTDQTVTQPPKPGKPRIHVYMGPGTKIKSVPLDDAASAKQAEPQAEAPASRPAFYMYEGDGVIRRRGDTPALDNKQEVGHAPAARRFPYTEYARFYCYNGSGFVGVVLVRRRDPRDPRSGKPPMADSARSISGSALAYNPTDVHANNN